MVGLDDLEVFSNYDSMILQLVEEGLFGDISRNINTYQHSQFYLEVCYIWSFCENPAIANKLLPENLCIVS